MILRPAVFVAALFILSAAHAAESDLYCQTGTSSTGNPNFVQVGPSAPCPVSSSPAPIKGFGTLSATNASALLSTLTVGPNSAAWPTSPNQMYVINSSASGGILYVCPLGGTCSATVGIPIAAGATESFFAPSTSMTVIAASTATVVAQW